MGFFEKLKSGLKKTRESITHKVDELLVSFGKIDEDLFDELEEILITSDIGVETTVKIVEKLKERVKKERITNALDVKKILKKVMMAAGDTFRAAAIDQLEIWAKRSGVDIIKHAEGADPSAVIYDAITASKARGYDVIVCDTAGRLHTKKNLMEELKKIFRVISRELPDADTETLLVLDATTGQNAVSQAKNFTEAAGVTGLVLTKLDGTAKGGIVVTIKSELNIPVKFIGVGEHIDELQPFDPKAFVDALFS